MIRSSDFDIKTASVAAEALREILANRLRKKVILGEERLVAGTLGEVIKLPVIIGRLEHRSAKQRALGLEEFQVLWDTLSAATRRSVGDVIGWYEPKELDWEDKRSNRRPDLTED